MTKFRYLAVALVAVLVAGWAQAADVTNLGRTTTVTLMSETADAGTQTKDQSVIPNAGTDRRGLYVIHYEVPAAGLAAGAHDLVTWEIPKGTIFVDPMTVEVQTAILPAAGTAAIACGGVDVLTAGDKLESATVQAMDSGPVQSTADDVPYITIAGTTATQGVFTVYLPVILGNAQ